ncbi:MAG: hypothetical protein ACRC0L_11765 [Angustibacter sp.]
MAGHALALKAGPSAAEALAMGSAAENPLASTRLRRCPACAAPARGEVAWCLQCYAPLTEAAPADQRVPQPTRPPVQPGPMPGPADPVQSLPDRAMPGPPDRAHRRPGRHAAEPACLDPAEARALADQMIAQFTAEPVAARGWVARVTASKSAGLLWAAVGLAIVAGTFLILGAVIGLLVD